MTRQSFARRSCPCEWAAAGKADSGVDLYWLPLGAGEPLRIVRWSGQIFEAIDAHRQHREPRELYHSALDVRLGDDQFVIEMAPALGNERTSRGVVAQGAVGFRWLGRSRFFRYEIRRWHDGVISDLAYAVDSPVPIGTDPQRTRRLMELVAACPTLTWGRDELSVGEMWNSNSLTAWLLARSGHDTGAVALPRRGRAPGWAAGLIVAARQQANDPALLARASTNGRTSV